MQIASCHTVMWCVFPYLEKKKDASSKLDWISLGGSEKRKVIAQLPSQFRELLPSEYWTAITELWKVCMYVKQTIIKYMYSILKKSMYQ